MRALARFKFWGRSPLTIIEFIIAFASLVGGLYMMSPFLLYSISVNGATPLVQTLGSEMGLIIFGGVYASSGVTMLAGLSKRNYRIRSFGLFLNIICRNYILIGTFLAQGLLPLTWLSSLCLMLIAVVCYIVVRGFIHRGVLVE